MRTGKFGLLLTLPILVALITVSSCKKDKSSLRSKDYALSAVTTGANGTVTISENADKSFNIKVSLNKSVKDTVHLAKLYSGSLTTPGALAVTLSNITGTGNAASGETRNITQIKLADNSMKNMTYDSIINYKAFIKVFHSAFRGDSLLAKGNVGNN
ncbi:MAG: hypothetical protein HYR66_07105 [Sphingobacteriales bacterium]|nr:hypothetical protein [Sphingobacteriales bacterium]MBI3718144.1 hypothetical protein [Sphingobacteriales bacterium]